MTPQAVQLLDTAVHISIGDKALPFKTGTGFCYFYVPDVDPSTLGIVHAVTCKHLLEGFPAEVTSHVSTNTVSGVLTHSAPIGEWMTHPERDVAVLELPFSDMKKAGARTLVYLSSHAIVTRQNAYSVGAHEGAGVYMVGFPVGWRPAPQFYPIVRGGMIGQIQGWTKGQHDTILISGATYPGNSGSPVVLSVPQQLDEPDPAWYFYLVGMVSQSTLSPLPTNPTLMETGDLTEVIPMDTINEIAGAARAAKLPLTSPSTDQGDQH